MCVLRYKILKLTNNKKYFFNMNKTNIFRQTIPTRFQDYSYFLKDC